jgi:alpha-glucuronidase
MRQTSVLFALVAVAVCAEVPDWPATFEESFKSMPAGEWTWVRERPDARRSTPAGLDLQVLSGTLWAKDNSGANLLVRPLPSTVAISTEVTLTNEPALLNEQAGLIWYAGDDDYIKLVKEMKEQPYIILGREEKQGAKTFGRIALPNATVSLRLTAADGRIVAHARTPDTPWQVVGECAPLQAGNLRGGIFASVSPGETDRWVRFTDFRVFTPAVRRE